jgi:DNA-binding transcriptional LysR family regulator
MMRGVTIHQLLCFDAVVTEGSFQAAAERLLRSQPTVSSSVKNLEFQLQLALLDRSRYRVVLTEAGRSFHERTRVFLHELRRLGDHAAQLAMGQESELRVVVGDLCPLSRNAWLASTFLRRLLRYEAASSFRGDFLPMGAPVRREADLILHHIDKADPRLEFIDLSVVKLTPVVAPHFLHFPISKSLTPEQMRDYVQCVIRDTARRETPRDYYLVEGARRWTVNDQLMKRELILQGMGWGHLPEYLIEQDLRDGRLLPITGTHFKGGQMELVAARRRNAPHGPIADRYGSSSANRLRNSLPPSHYHSSS